MQVRNRKGLSEFKTSFNDGTDQSHAIAVEYDHGLNGCNRDTNSPYLGIIDSEQNTQGLFSRLVKSPKCSALEDSGVRRHDEQGRVNDEQLLQEML